jgi:ferredoxin
MARVNPDFVSELYKYGEKDFSACYNCGNCTAICSLSTAESSFPREMVRYTTLGLEDEIKSSLKPWQCYACGECTTDCPRQADPSELMMSLRRWLMAQYDWTGLSGLLYKSLPFTIAAFVLTLLGVLLYAIRQDFNLAHLMEVGHVFEKVAIGTVGVVILLPNLIRMWYFTILKPNVKVPFVKYVTSLGELFVHMFTQKRSLGCDSNRLRWFEHFILVIAYLSLLFTTVFLNLFSTESMFVHILGYVLSAVVFIVTIDFVSHRVRKTSTLTKKSQPADWLFVVWLLLMGLTAFLVKFFQDMSWLEANKWLYIVHFTVLVQWALIIVPFGKWSHFLYRSFAMYFEELKG